MVDLGGADLDEYGFCLDIVENPTIEDQKIDLGSKSTTGVYRDSITDLISGRKYYIKAYALSSQKVFYSEQRSFTTKPPAVPVVTTKSITDIGTTTAKGGGDVTDHGGSMVTERGVCWDVSDNPTVAGDRSTDGGGTGSFVSQLEGLSCNTTYYVRAYATNASGTGYGQSELFSTQYCDVVKPTVTTTSIANITDVSVICAGKVTDNGGGTITARGICWSTSLYPTIFGTHTTETCGIGTFTSEITGLTCNTIYYIRAFASNSAGTSYGEQMSFNTSGCEAGLPTVTSQPVTNVTETEATSGGYVTDDGGSSVTARGVCWNNTGSPEVTGHHTINGSGTGAFASQLTGLTCNSGYFVRAYATNSSGTSYGVEQSFDTDACSGVLPLVTTSDIGDVTESSARGGGTVTDEGGSDVTARGICWSTSVNPTTSNNHTENGSGAGAFNSDMVGLACNTTYYVRAYATNSSGTAYGELKSFGTSACPSGIPVVSTFAISNITESTAVGGGNVTDDGGEAVTARGVCWSTSQNPDISDQHSADGNGWRHVYKSSDGTRLQHHLLRARLRDQQLGNGLRFSGEFYLRESVRQR